MNEGETITELAVATVQRLVASAQWKLNYYQWLERIEGARDDDYWQGKYQQFLILASALAQFDAHTLAQIVRES